MSKYSQLRAEKDEFFKFQSQSPLTNDQKKDFSGLNYFPPDPALQFEVEINEFDVQKELLMQTTTGDVQKFIRFGQVDFDVNGNSVTLAVYANQHGFFIPFVDALAGNETYGAGRYLDPQVLPNGKLDLDFNLAYNPYCAYNEMYSCPLPLAENRLNVAIRAGEKNFN